MLERILRELHRDIVLSRHNGIDTSADLAFGRFVERIAASFEAPFALVSVVRGDRLWFKATHGIQLSSERRCDVFCDHVLDTEHPLEVCDATADERFRALPVVTGALAIRYYLGVRLRLSGVGVGALCILDTAVRPPATPDQRAYLLAVARQATAALEWRANELMEHAA